MIKIIYVKNWVDASFTNQKQLFHGFNKALACQQSP